VYTGFEVVGFHVVFGADARERRAVGAVRQLEVSRARVAARLVERELDPGKAGRAHRELVIVTDGPDG
jgi:hypothetical protein